MPVKAIESLAEFHRVINGEKPVIVDFWATWCGPCRMISPVLEKLSNEGREIDCYKVDVDAQDEIAQEVKIRAMPTFHLYKNGEQVDSLIGAQPSALQTLINKHAPKSS